MKKVTFKIPEAYQVPEGVMDGQTFDESVTFKLTGDSITLTAINGVPLDWKAEGEKAQAMSLADQYEAAQVA